ncbi:MAG: class I SAM-dependent methyltransferase [Opitutaceae bacterium]|nr:class I SAM-dependent methyltransferase [Opitutaceae bacterium]
MPAGTSHTVVFEWNPDDFDVLLESCDRDDGVQLALKHLPKEGKILEAGSGTGRVVRYLHDRGYDIEGFELNAAIIAQMKQSRPDLPVFVGDVAQLPRPDGYYTGLVSYGTIEHFIKGVEAPLHEHFRVLAPGGIAVITVPSYNTLRRLKYLFDVCFRRFNPRMNNLVRRALQHQPMRRNIQGRGGFRYHVYPQFLGFFEYRLRPREFEDAVRAAGFKILHSVPITHLDGIYHELGPPLIEFRRWKFYPTPLALWLDRVFRRIPFFHNHMHAIVATK